MTGLRFISFRARQLQSIEAFAPRSRNSEAADSDVFIHGIYKRQQPVNGGRRDWSCWCFWGVCRGFRDN